MQDIDKLCINTIRGLSADIVQKANSGHPGMPMGSAPMAYALWSRILRANPEDPKWPNRDRFILSAGHASALLYTLLHLFGYDLPMAELKKFRQWGSKTPGHPEVHLTPGVEATTGPLGQGIANAVGMAIAESYLAKHFNRPSYEVVDHWTYALCGDGCMMEGVASEAASLAGTLALGKLVILYDDNEISIEGDTDIAFREDVGKRFEAYGWQVIRVKDGNDPQQVLEALELAKQSTDRPKLIIAPTKIGYGSPREGMASAHGEPLGEENLATSKKNLGLSSESFHVPQEVKDHLEAVKQRGVLAQSDWEEVMRDYRAMHPDLSKEWDVWFNGTLPEGLMDDAELWHFEGKSASRASSGVVLNRLAQKVTNLIGGSADLAPSNKSDMKGRGEYSAEDRGGANLHFGVREFAMAAICNGMSLHGGLRPYGATFFVFSDYMKNGMRMSALMELPVTYILTHDSIGVGEDGPTHQPIEQLAGLRSIPNLIVFRPADSREVVAGWLTALTAGLPTSLVLTRQDLPLYERSGKEAMKGGYILSDSEKAVPDAILMASGSEVEQMMEAQKLLKQQNIDARVVSMPSMELFDAQDAAYREKVLPVAVRARVAMEAGATMPWWKYVGLDGAVLGIDHYGASAPASKLFEEFGFTAQHAVDAAKASLKKA